MTANSHKQMVWIPKIILLMGVVLFGVFWSSPQAHPFTARVNISDICTRACRTVHVTQYGVKPNDGLDDSLAINKLLEANGKNVILTFPVGVYHFKSPIYRDGLQNVIFHGVPGAELRKTQPYRGEYLLYSRFSRNVVVRGLIFRGLTENRKVYNWGESGVYLASSDGVIIDNNRFYNFGDAAIRVTTSRTGPKGVASSNTVVRNNYFENISQISTTSNQNNYGGTFGYLLQNNTFKNLKGSVKFASRTPGAGEIIIQDNRIGGVRQIPTSNGLEISSYSNVFIENNQITHCGNFGINIYTNTGANITGFDWGNYFIRGNTISQCPKGIRVSAQPYRNGYSPKVNTIVITDNILNVSAPNAIQLLNGKIISATVKGNKNR